MSTSCGHIRIDGALILDGAIARSAGRKATRGARPRWTARSRCARPNDPRDWRMSRRITDATRRRAPRNYCGTQAPGQPPPEVGHSIDVRTSSRRFRTLILQHGRIPGSPRRGRFVADQSPTYVELHDKGNIPPVAESGVLRESSLPQRGGQWTGYRPDRFSTVLFTDIVASSEHAARSAIARGASPPTTSRARPSRIASLSRRRGGHCGRRFLCQLRWAGARTAARARLQTQCGVGHRGPCRGAHGRVRGRRRQGDRNRRPYRSAVASQAQPGEVLVSSTVKDLVAGPASSSKTAAPQSSGIPGNWRLFAVANGPVR